MNKFLLSLALSLFGITFSAQAMDEGSSSSSTSPSSSSSSSSANEMRAITPAAFEGFCGFSEGRQVSMEDVLSAQAPTPEQIKAAEFSPSNKFRLNEVVIFSRDKNITFSWGIVWSPTSKYADNTMMYEYAIVVGPEKMRKHVSADQIGKLPKPYFVHFVQ